MNKLFLILVLGSIQAFSQTYKPERTRSWDLLHSTLHVQPIWQSKTLNGQAELKLKPWFYSQTTLLLDARGFEIKAIKDAQDQELKYDYDAKSILIYLSKPFQRSDTFTVKIDYIAKPYELISGGSAAISSDQGLYFIEENSQPLQFWTQGETQSNSAWFPTIDSPNEKHTQDVYITVDNQFVTLSNGLLIAQVQNRDSTRTDHWKQTLPHAPYLTMIAGGKFTVVKDEPHEGKEISYYVDPQYAQNAQAIFGRTKGMLTFFEQKLGIKYPWDKYAQIAVRDFVSGAMENSSAVVHGDFVLKNNHELVDKNDDETIAHELFHHWFGDLATCESWANLPLNEAFANYAEYLWLEHTKGKIEADLHHKEDLEGYLFESINKQEPLIRYLHHDNEEMFDAHSYNKGGRVLHMLRNYVGDEAFYEALRIYLTDNQFKSVEIHDLRQAFEAVTGEDLNWFFDQWFLKAGHPVLTVSSNFSKGKLKVNIQQTGKQIFRLPMNLQIWNEGISATQKIVLEDQNAEFVFEMPNKPNLVLLDPDAHLLAEINHPKTKEEYIKQVEMAPNVISKIGALDSLSLKFYSNKIVKSFVISQLDNSIWKIREMAVDFLTKNFEEETTENLDKIMVLSRQDKHPVVRAKSIIALGKYPRTDAVMTVFVEALKDTSYSVRAEALRQLVAGEHPELDQVVANQRATPSGAIQLVVADYLSNNPKAEDFDWYITALQKQKPEVKYEMLQIFSKYLIGLEESVANKGVLTLKIALLNPQAYVRFGAFQALILFSDQNDVKKAMLEAIRNEKEPTLKSIFNQLKATLD